MSLLHDWLGPEERTRFLQGGLGKVPFARPGALGPRERACDWTMLEGALASRAADPLVVAAGQVVTTPAPRTLPALRRLFATGIGVALRNANHASQRIAAVCRALAEDVPGAQRAIIFATPAATHSFGWHFDAEEVFIAQTAGSKTYYFRANSVSPRPLQPCPHAFEAMRSETTPMLACRLDAGDCLYLPSGYWHLARAESDSLSISLGVVA